MDVFITYLIMLPLFIGPLILILLIIIVSIIKPHTNLICGIFGHSASANFKGWRVYYRTNKSKVFLYSEKRYICARCGTLSKPVRGRDDEPFRLPKGWKASWSYKKFLKEYGQ